MSFWAVAGAWANRREAEIKLNRAMRIVIPHGNRLLLGQPDCGAPEAVLATQLEFFRNLLESRFRNRLLVHTAKGWTKLLGISNLAERRAIQWYGQLSEILGGLHVVGLGTGIRRRKPPDPAVLEESSVITYGSISSRLAVCWPGLVVIIAQFAVSQSSPANQRILTELPNCSVLRTELERRNRSNGADQAYMQKMRQQGVKHALLLIHADLSQGKTNNIHVGRRLYFRSFDGPDSQISDQTALKTIESSGLGTDLEAIASIRVSKAPLVRGPDMHLRSVHDVSSTIEFFADPSVPQRKVVLLPSGHPTPLTEAVINGDALRTQELLASHKFAQNEFDRALFDAALSRYDNTTVIKLLLQAGADVNARAPDGTTPLMNSVAHPCNLQPLLEGGADLNARDKWGRDALRVAREVKENTAIRLLEEASSKKEPKS